MPKIVLASLCLQQLQQLPTLLCVGRDVLGCCQLAVKEWIACDPPSLSTCGRFARAPLTVAARCGTDVLFDGISAMAAASWQSKNRLLRYSRSKLPILIKMCCGGSAGPVRQTPFQTLFHCSMPVPDPDHPRTTPDPLPGQMAGSHINCSQTILCAWVMGVYILATQTQYTPWEPLSFKSGRWDLRDRSEAEWTASHGTQWVTLATGRVLASARALAFQGKAALNRCTIRITCRWEVKTSGS